LHNQPTPSYISQAVILAGGRGTRLKPLTDKVPKPMVEFHGKPFLEYLIENLREQGIRSVLLLLGYLPDVIQEYFGDGRKFGVKIDYSITDVANDTSRRLKLAAPQIESCFLLMYCDNYWPLRLRDMWTQFTELNVSGQVTIYSNTDNYTKDNVRVDNDYYVLKYDKTRAEANLHGVDIGYVILKKDVLDYLPEDNVLFESTAYPHLVENRQLAAYVTDHRYYSVGSFDRLKMTESFLGRVPAIILDRDGVLNKKPPKAEYVKTWDEFEWLPGARKALALLKKADYKIIVVTNQAGIERGFMTEEDLKEINDSMKREAGISGGDIDAVYYCPHGWDSNCDCRKPKPGMLFQAQRDFHLDLTRTYFIGDDTRDEQAGIAAGCKTILISKESSLLCVIKELISG
jgi:histidinol-phosphate phosphatase family protein